MSKSATLVCRNWGTPFSLFSVDIMQPPWHLHDSHHKQHDLSGKKQGVDLIYAVLGSHSFSQYRQGRGAPVGSSATSLHFWNCFAFLWDQEVHHSSLLLSMPASAFCSPAQLQSLTVSNESHLWSARLQDQRTLLQRHWNLCCPTLPLIPRLHSIISRVFFLTHTSTTFFLLNHLK